MRHHNFLMCNSSIGHMRCLIDHVNRLSTYRRNLAIIHWSTGLYVPTDFWPLLHVPVDTSRSNHTLKYPCYVIWRHPMSSSLYVSSYISMSTLVLVHVTNTSSYDVSSSTARSLTRPRQCSSLTNLDLLTMLNCWPFPSVDHFALILDQKSKYPKRAYLA